MTTRKNNDMTAVILSGGKSMRMGTDKSLLKIGDVSLIERAIFFCKNFFDKIIISTNDSANYEFTGLECIQDIYPNLGPISGIHAGLFRSKGEKIFILSADLVFDEVKLIETIIEHKTEKSITLPLVDDIPQYTFGIYSKSVLPEIEKMILECADYKPTPRQLIKKVEAELIDLNKCIYFEKEKFINLNTPTDYERAKLIFEKGNNQ